MGRILKFLRNLFCCHKRSEKNVKHQEQTDNKCSSIPTILATVNFDSDNDVISLKKCSTTSVAAKTDAGNPNSYPRSEFTVIQPENEFKLQLEPIADDKGQDDRRKLPIDYESDEEDADRDPETEDYAVVDQKFMMSIHELLFNTSRQPEGEDLERTTEEGELGGGSDNEPLVFPSVPNNKFTKNNNEGDHDLSDANGSDTPSCPESNEGGSDNLEDGNDWFTLSQREFESDWYGLERNQITFHSNMPLSTIVEESEPDDDSADEPLEFSFVTDDKFTGSNNHGVDKPYEKLETNCEDLNLSGQGLCNLHNVDNSDTWSGVDLSEGGSDDLEGDNDWCTLYSM